MENPYCSCKLLTRARAGLQTSLYDGIVAEPDDYHQWFEREMGGKKPETGWPQIDMNSWRGEAYAIDETVIDVDMMAIDTTT